MTQSDGRTGVDADVLNPKDAAARLRPPLSCVPMPVVYEVAAGLFEGARKYGRHNWRRSRVLASVYYDAALRHLAAWWEGEDIDPDSGIPHLSKAMAGLMVLRDAQMTGQSVDDRPSKSPADWMAIARELVAGIAKRVPEKV